MKKKINAKKFKNVKFNKTGETVDVLNFDGEVVGTLDIDYDLSMGDLKLVEEFAEEFVCDGKGFIYKSKEEVGLRLIYLMLFVTNLDMEADTSRKQLTEEQIEREQGYTTDGLYNLVINSNIYQKIREVVPEHYSKLIDEIYYEVLNRTTEKYSPNLSKTLSELIDSVVNKTYDENELQAILNVAKKITNHEIDEKALAEAVLEYNKE